MGEVREGELLEGLRRGGWVIGVLVAEQRPPGEPDVIEYTPFLLLNWHRGYVGLAAWRGGVRSWRDFDRLLRFLREDLGWHGPVCLHEPNDRRLRQQAEICRVLGLDPLRPRWRPRTPSDPSSEGSDDTGDSTAGDNTKA
ncbi:hypothetical protein [Paracraurococcus lichenis]|uniref:Uncharacterized protein n=1 Tax=Paracraurococcus lichenis TaxID=3064888 RepID=A0ABT9E6H5_9PROT|nr:hypothetical protein [Paracraurococcus sp. LOR1-02]MDO9711786.1 hypothetical protein [Paracraurococcus sp. LOR1-02]